MNLSIQAKILAIIYLILTCITVLGALVNRTVTANGVIVTVIWLALAALIVYDTHCLTDATCTSWSSIRTVFYSIIPVLAIITMIMELFNPSKESDVVKG